MQVFNGPITKLSNYSISPRSSMLKSDRWIRKVAREHDMINPFSEKQVREGVVSYGLSSYGYDLRVADEFKIFTNVNSTIVTPRISTRSPSSPCAPISASFPPTP